VTKKEKESFVFSSFSKLHFGHEVKFDQPNPPEPDVVFILNDKKIGCELTTIYVDNEPGEKDSNSKKNESIQESICNTLEKWMSTNIRAFFEIHLCFNNRLIPDGRIKELTKKILHVIETYISDLNLEEFSHLMIDHYGIVPSELDYISICTFPALDRMIVSRAGGTFVPRLNRNRIISNINHKEKLINRYAHLTDLNWLLLSINESLLSSEFDLIEETYQDIVTRFDKVFLFSKRDQKIVTIK
jgi:hypothetical protein